MADDGAGGASHWVARLNHQQVGEGGRLAYTSDPLRRPARDTEPMAAAHGGAGAVGEGQARPWLLLRRDPRSPRARRVQAAITRRFLTSTTCAMRAGIHVGETVTNDELLTTINEGLKPLAVPTVDQWANMSPDERERFKTLRARVIETQYEMLDILAEVHQRKKPS